MLNFEKYPDLLNQVNKMAHKDLRPVEMQIIYLVKEGLVDGEA